MAINEASIATTTTVKALSEGWILPSVARREISMLTKDELQQVIDEAGLLMAFAQWQQENNAWDAGNGFNAERTLAMDPNEALKMLRESAAMWSDPETEDFDYADRMAEAFAALDQWLSKGGFWPSDWNPSGGSTCGRCADADESERKKG